jgi:hypothetical protein
MKARSAFVRLFKVMSMESEANEKAHACKSAWA